MIKSFSNADELQHMKQKQHKFKEIENTDHLLILSTQQPLTLWGFEAVEVIQYCAATPHFFIS